MIRQISAMFLVFAAGFSNHAHADSPQFPYTYLTESENGQYVFVMLSTYSEPEERQFWNEEIGTEISRIRQQYFRSGLYRKDDPTTPLWTVDWYAYSVLPFSDGVHLVREGPWAQSGWSEGASFFANGELLKSYTVSDLVFASWAMPRTVSHFFWREETSVDDDALSYEVLTLHRERLRFDARTGEIIASFSPPKWISISLLAFIVGFVLVQRHRRNNSGPQ